MEYRWNPDSGDWEVWDAQEPLDGENCSISFDPEIEELYWTALNSELAYPVTRTMTEWVKFETPMTKDDVLDTVLFIRGLP